MASSEHWTEFSISDSLVDDYQHVNNAAYMSLFEKARWRWLLDRGMNSDRQEFKLIRPVVLEARLEFRREIRSGENIRILTRPIRFRSRAFDIYHEIRKESQEVACRADYQLGFFDMNSRRICRPGPEWKKILGEIDESL